MIQPQNNDNTTKGVFHMKPINPIKKELYVEPEIQDVEPVSIVVRGDGDGSGEEEEESGRQ